MQNFNFIVPSIRTSLKVGHCISDELPLRIAGRAGEESYYCQFDLEKRDDFKKYVGTMRPALGAWVFDFDGPKDDQDALSLAKSDLLQFVSDFDLEEHMVFFSGNRGFHLYIPYGYLPILPDKDCSRTFGVLLKELKKFYKTLDQSVCGANHKIRSPFSKHPKTGMMKCLLGKDIGLLDADKIFEMARLKPKPCEIVFNSVEPSDKFLTVLEKLGHECRVEDAPASDGGRHKKLLIYTLKTAEVVSSHDELVDSVFEYDSTMNDPKGPYFSDKSAADDAVTKWVDWKKHINPDWTIGHSLGFQSKSSGFYIYRDGSKLPQYHELAKYVFEKIKIVTNSGGISYRFNLEKQHYESISTLDLERLVADLTGEHLSPNHLCNFIKIIKTKTLMPQEFFAPPQGLLNMKNGILDVKKRVLLKHNPSLFFQYVVPHDYDPMAGCDAWIRWLNNIFHDNLEFKFIVAQIFGYILYGGDPFLHKAFLLIGEGRNGKSTFLKVLTEMVGQRNCSNVSLSKLDKEFFLVNLDGKLVNVAEETPSEARVNSEVFKTVVAGGSIAACRKYHDIYEFNPTARFIFACNRLPKFDENSFGVDKRLYFIPFNAEFVDENADPFIFERDLRMEIPGIINWALVGLEILLNERRLPELECQREVFEEYKAGNDSVFEFVLERITISKDDKIPIETIYNSYRCFCQESGRLPVSKINFSRSFLNHLNRRYPTAVRTRMYDNLKRVRGFEGISISGNKVGSPIFLM